ncbi:MAG: hypothetical protein WCW35_00095 [Bacteroidota bacterium]
MKITTYTIAFVTLFLLFSTLSIAQSGREYRRTGVMNGNQVRTVFGNWGVIGQPGDKGPRGAWKHDNNGYIGDVSPLVSAEVHWLGKTFHSSVTNPTDRPTQKRDEDPISNKPWTLEPISGYFNANQSKIAISGDPKSWPLFWPDKMTDPTDPGWKQNPNPSLKGYAAWNGYFGKKIGADLETYFVMDDNNDERFNYKANNTFSVDFKPDSTNTSRNGLGLKVSVRAMQWNDFLAKDNIFWLYDITNTGTTNYSQVVFGTIVGTYVGVTGADGGPQEYNDDWSFYDVYNNLTYTGDYKKGGPSRNPLWVGRVGMVGYAFLESPGNPYDGIDNDGDADSSAIGLTSPLFLESMFTDSILIIPGKKVIVINNDYSRSEYIVPNVDSVIIPTRGNTTYVYPKLGTKVIEGNAVKVTADSAYVNLNAYDGVDNNYNGLVDENQYLHFRAVKRSGTKILLDVPHQVRFVDYVNGKVKSPLGMIDERRDDGVDNNSDWNFVYDDVGRDGTALTGDFGEGDGIATSGYKFDGTDSDLPGEPHIDKTDVRESDQLGLTSFYYFTPANKVILGDDESIWKNLAPGFFDVPTTIVNNEPIAGEDGDFIYGSGYFPLLAKATERFSLALVYGGGYGGKWPDDDIADLLKNKKIVQQIYDANYQFPLAPEKPQLSAVADDQKVTLYWDRRAEESVDPVLLIKDFEGYKIYKSTDPNFSDIFTITDASGVPQMYKPLVQFDLKDGVQGFYESSSSLHQQASGLSFDLGHETGLQHSFVDDDVQNGRRYFYAIVAYDRGNEALGLFPKENTKFVTISPEGKIDHDINVVVVTPNAKTTGYVSPVDTSLLTRTSGFSSGTVRYKIIDPTKLTGHTYHITFFDTQNDTLDNNGNTIKDIADSTEWTRVTTFYNVKDEATFTETFEANDTVIVNLLRKNIDASTIVVKNASGGIVAANKYEVDVNRGTIHASAPGNLPKANYSISYKYYPVWRSPNMQRSQLSGLTIPSAKENFDTDIFDGLQLEFNNDWATSLNTIETKWINTPKQYAINFHAEPLFNNNILLYRKPSDYEIQISDHYVDTAQAHPDWAGFLDTLSTKFRIYNVSDSTYIKFYLYDSNTVKTGDLASGQQIIFLEKGPNGRDVPTWTVYLPDSNFVLTSSSKLSIKTNKPFNSNDLFELTLPIPTSDLQVAKANPLKVRVVPNPYVTSSSFELPLNPGITSGRGERKIDFIHLPASATVKVFTSRGDHLVTLYHDGNIEDGSVSWNLKTKENLDIAYGVYFYVVESPAGNQTGKIAIIK